MPTSRPLALAFLCLALALPAGAEDLGLILSNQNYRTQPELRSGRAADRMTAALQSAGFTVVRIQDRSLGDEIAQIESLRTRITDAGRLVIVLNGHMVSAGDRAWLLAPEAGTPSDISVGTMGLPLRPLLDMAAGHPGEALVAVAAQSRDAATGETLDPGYAPGPMPQGVTLLTGSADDLAGLFTGGLLTPGQQLSRSLAAWPNVHADGYVPLRAALLPASPEGPATVAPAPRPSREERLAKAEADLNLGREDRRRVQRSLAILGFDPRGIDGLIGPGTRAAIRGWQDDRKLEPTGYLDRSELNQLFKEGDKRAAELEAEARRKQEEQDARDAAYWRETGQGKDEPGLRAYLEHYPDGLFADTARARLDAIEAARRPQASPREQRDWQQAQDEDTVRAYGNYLQAWPDGIFAEEAQRRLDQKRAEAGTDRQRREWEAEERNVAGSTVARKLVENRLAGLGLKPGPVDGEFTDQTRRAIRRFQETRGLEVTGYVNQQTMVRILFGS